MPAGDNDCQLVTRTGMGLGYMVKKPSGFTLIELMIVVAIVGILAAIALPSYMGYTARAQASEAFTISAPVRSAVAEFYNEKGRVPTDAEAGELFSDNLAGKYVGSVTLEGGGEIEILFANGALEGESITLSPEAATSQLSGWSCLAEPSVERHLPDACK